MLNGINMSVIKLFFTSLVFLSAFPATRKGQTKAEHPLHAGVVNPIVVDEPLLIEGLEVKDFNRRRCIQLKEGMTKGLAEIYFFDFSASYDLTLFYADEASGKSAITVSINNKPAGSISFDEELKEASFTFKKKTLAAVNIQKWSRISLQFTGDGKEKCRLEKLVFTPVGAFQGDNENLKKPKSLQVF